MNQRAPSVFFMILRKNEIFLSQTDDETQLTYSTFKNLKKAIKKRHVYLSLRTI
jgi:hypothetical protein